MPRTAEAVSLILTVGLIPALIPASLFFLAHF
jgi:hypothetical protein